MNITEETIDAFLRGDLNGTEADAFTKAIASDPKLQQEVWIQKDIIDAIKQNRHQQLKDRLNAIEVKGGVGFYASPYIKLAASIGIVALIVGAFSTFYNGEKTETVVESNATGIASAPQSNEKESSLSETQNTNTRSEVEKTTSLSPSAYTASDKTTASTTATTNTSKIAKPAVSKSKDNQTSDAGTFEDPADEPLDSDKTIEGINDNFDMPTMNHGGNTSGISSPQIKVSIVKENNLGYRFFNNQLFLHGNFSNSTYELFELNNKPSKQLFLYFENNYYELIQGKTKLTSLTPITDKGILLQLTQLREH